MAILHVKLCSFKAGGSLRVGGVVEEKIYDLNYCHTRMLADEKKATSCYGIATKEVPSEMVAFIEGGQHTLDLARGAIEYIRKKGIKEGPGGEKLVYDLNTTQLSTPIARPSIWCMGLVFKSHAEIGGLQVPKEPTFFHKPQGCLVGPEEMVIIPKAYPHMIVYGTELTLVFGKSGKNISEERAYDYVYGYTVLNDVTARGIPVPQNKIMDTFAPVGPWIVPKDQISTPGKLALRFRVNGVETQNGNTSEMLFNIPMHVRILTSYCRIHPGDLLATGDIGAPGPLKPGDVMEAEVEEIGVLRNPTKLEE
ncbi:MAG: fumarylacetoacetate hydrolase family protein [Deltaproteobacteria bacterium]|nr:fumarylacetoacetate hydrolase family protein [Deltaproteobacteria bacterium]